MNIGSLKLTGKFFLAPMEAVNCASFRVLCKRRGAALIYTDMIDADVFVEFLENNSKQEAIDKFVNPQSEEKPLAIQLGGRDTKNLIKTYETVKEHAALIDLNIGCPLGYMLGKKGGCYLMKHPDQLYKIVKELRAHIKVPFTVKMRSGWDEQSMNAQEIAKELQNVGVDAITLHPRTRKQRYQKKANWNLAKKVRESITIPFILSGDVTNAYQAKQAIEQINPDFIMIGRGAKNNPSIFTQLKKLSNIKPDTTYNKKEIDPINDFKEWLALYKSIEKRYKLSEIRDHALWAASECKNNKEVTKQLMDAGEEKELLSIIEKIEFS